MGISTASGQTIFRYTTGTPGATFWGAPSVASGMVFTGNQNGNLYAFGL
jgi:outer membrane protein assembly factor BamB